MDNNANTGLARGRFQAQTQSDPIVLDDGPIDLDKNRQAVPGNPNGVVLERRTDRKRNRQEMSTSTRVSEVIELLDDDDDHQTNNLIDLSFKPAAVVRIPSPIKDGEIEVLDGPQRKPPPGASSAAVAGPPPSLLRVLEIFPDVDMEYVKTKLREHNNNIEIVVAVLSENSNYPKQKKRSETNRKISNNTLIRGIKSNEPKHDYSSPSASFEMSAVYRREVFNVLLHDFVFLKQNGLQSLLVQNQYRYTLTRNHIHDMIVGKTPNSTAVAAAAAGSVASANKEKTENQNYQLLRSVLVRGALPKEVKQRLGNSYCLKKPRRKIGVAPPKITDPTLLDEHCSYERKFQEWVEGVREKLRGQAANKLALENGTAVTCGCCFDDVAISECVPCKEQGHLFCKECIVQYVESQVFGSGNLGIDKETKKPALELKCCEGSGCNSGFREELLEKVLPPKVWQKYSEMQTNAQIQQAGLGGIFAMCPKCGYQAEVPEMQNIFECPVEECQFTSCRKCGRESHIPLRCDEVAKQDRRDKGRLAIEEALSKARMRTCPKCKKNIVKSDGCNKMTCACGMKMCYTCRAPLDKLQNPYSHFCQIAHCDHSSCGNCLLYTKNQEEEDAQAMREAGIAAKEAFEQKLQTDGEESVKLSVDEIMGNTAQSVKKKQKRRAAALANVRAPALPIPVANQNRQGRHRGNNRNNRNQPPMPPVPPWPLMRAQLEAEQARVREGWEAERARIQAEAERRRAGYEAERARIQAEAERRRAEAEAVQARIEAERARREVDLGPRRGNNRNHQIPPFPQVPTVPLPPPVPPVRVTRMVPAAGAVMNPNQQDHRQGRNNRKKRERRR